MTVLDPAKRYAEVDSGGNVMNVFTGETAVFDTPWTRFIEVPQGVTVLVGYRYYEGQFSPKPTFTPIDLSDVDNLEKTLKALALVMRDYCNALQAGTYTTKTVANLRADFKAKYDGLP